MAMKENLVQVKAVCFSCPPRGKIIREANLEIGPESRTAVIGDNGAGKTTLLHLIMGLKRPEQGKVFLFGKTMRQETDFRMQRTKLGFVFQDADDQLFCPTVLEDVSFGPLNMGFSMQESLERAHEALARLNMQDYPHRVTHRLSGGEKKLVSLATVLSMHPRMLILDEPTTGLDQAHRQKIIEIIRDIDLPHLIVSHDFDFLEHTSNELYMLRDGHLHAESRSVLHSHRHAHPLGDTSHAHGNHGFPER